jgi:hypothetical protein
MNDFDRELRDAEVELIVDRLKALHDLRPQLQSTYATLAIRTSVQVGESTAYVPDNWQAPRHRSQLLVPQRDL